MPVRDGLPFSALLVAKTQAAHGRSVEFVLNDRMEIKWTDNDPATGERRYLCAERFGGKWTFWYKYQRRGEWTHRFRPRIDTWELVLDALERKYRRRDGVSDADLKQVQDILKRLRLKHPAAEDDPAAEM